MLWKIWKAGGSLIGETNIDVVLSEIDVGGNGLLSAKVGGC